MKMHKKKLVIVEKPSIAQSLVKVIGANKRLDGYLEDNGYLACLQLTALCLSMLF